MKLDLSQGWELSVERGPDWLFVRLVPPQDNLFDEQGDLAQRIWDVLEQAFCRRVVIELDQLHVLPSYVIGQLIVLHRRVRRSGGILRICGLSRQCEDVLRINGLSDRFVCYADRNDAVMGRLSSKPR